MTAQVRHGLLAVQRRQGWYLLSGAAAKRATGDCYAELVRKGRDLEDEEAKRVIQVRSSLKGVVGRVVGGPAPYGHGGRERGGFGARPLGFRRQEPEDRLLRRVKSDSPKLHRHAFGEELRQKRRISLQMSGAPRLLSVHELRCSHVAGLHG